MLQQSRIKSLLDSLSWAQPEMARFLGVGQATISRYAASDREPGPVARLLDSLQAGLSDGRVVKGMDHAAALAALRFAQASEGRDAATVALDLRETHGSGVGPSHGMGVGAGAAVPPATRPRPAPGPLAQGVKRHA